MLTAKGISKEYDNRKILDGVDITLLPGKVIGLVGDNGSGKTTLVQILAGNLKQDLGIVQNHGVSIGYLPQNPKFEDETVDEFLHKYLQSSKYDYLIDIAFARLELNIDRKTNCLSLSGGQRTKVYLSTLLLLDPPPEILLLDEPTNNLDIEGLDQLTGFIKSFNGSVLIISHDRKFLDDTVSEIYELSHGKIKKYSGNYTQYREQKLHEEELKLQEYEANRDELKKLQRLIKAKMERVERLDKAKPVDNDKFAHTFLRERAMKKVSGNKRALESKVDQFITKEKPEIRTRYNYGFSGQTHQGKLLLAAENISKSFDHKKLFTNISFEIRGKARIHLKGTNGSGKSTLLKILTGKLSYDNGEIRTGENVNIGYFSQDTLIEDENKVALDILLSITNDISSCYKSAKQMHLNEFDLKEQMKNLSRGQQVKIQLLKLILGKYELLILDEPTNHLEISSREEIEDSLMDYKGALIVASHDRYFIESLEVTDEISL